jgi:hypothetical protein
VTVSKELSKYELDLVRVQVRREREHIFLGEREQESWESQRKKDH